MRRSLLLAALLAPLACGDDDNALRASGTVEVVEVDVAPMVPARVLRVWVEEGATVGAGDTVATLSLTTLPADIAGRRARLAAAEASLRDLRAGARPAEIEQAASQVAAAAADSARAARDLARARDLAARQVVSQQALDAARGAAEVAASRLAAARDALRLVREGARAERIRAAEAEVEAARATLEGARATAADLVLLSPVAGRVLSRHAEAGEVLPAGVPAATIGETARPWVRIYLPARVLAGVQPGTSARITVPGNDARAWAGRVTAISDRAEFTPRVALSEEERSDLLFGVKVEVADTSGTLKPGMPAEVELEELTRDGRRGTTENGPRAGARSP